MSAAGWTAAWFAKFPPSAPNSSTSLATSGPALRYGKGGVQVDSLAAPFQRLWVCVAFLYNQSRTA